MKNEHIQFLDANKHFWTEFKANQAIRHFDNATRKKLQEIALTFDPKAVFCTWCNDDAMNMLKYVYTQYEKGAKKKEESKEIDNPYGTKDLDGEVKKETFPLEEIPTVEEMNIKSKRGHKSKNKADEPSK